MQFQERLFPRGPTLYGTAKPICIEYFLKRYSISFPLSPRSSHVCQKSFTPIQSKDPPGEFETCFVSSTRLLDVVDSWYDVGNYGLSVNLVKLHLYNFNTSIDLPYLIECFLRRVLIGEEHAHCRNRLKKSISSGCWKEGKGGIVSIPFIEDEISQFFLPLHTS